MVVCPIARRISGKGGSPGLTQPGKVNFSRKVKGYGYSVDWTLDPGLWTLDRGPRIKKKKKERKKARHAGASGVIKLSIYSLYASPLYLKNTKTNPVACPPGYKLPPLACIEINEFDFFKVVLRLQEASKFKQELITQKVFWSTLLCGLFSNKTPEKPLRSCISPLPPQ